MKFKNDEALNTYLKDVEFEEHELVPYFIVDETSVFYDSSIENDEGLLVVDNFKTEVLDGIIYAKMDSTHKNMDGITFSGAEPTYIALSGNLKYSQERQGMWQEQFGDAISANTMMEVRRVAGLTLEEYKAELIKALQDEMDDVTFVMEVVSSAKGEDRIYKVNLKTVSEIESQLNRAIDFGGIVQAHDISRYEHEDYTIEEATQLYTDISISVAWRNGQIAEYCKRVEALTEKTSIDEIKAIPLSEEEMARVQAMVMKALGQ